MGRFVLRLWLPDRPGALGHVASRIGALHGDVVGIEILEQGAGRAIDELIVALPDTSPVELLIAEIAQVEGVGIENVHELPGDAADPLVVILEAAARLVEQGGDARTALDSLCRDLVVIFDGEWSSVVGVGPVRLLAAAGSPPSAEWLAALASGVQHLGDDAGPDDVVVAGLPNRDVVLAVGREGRPFRRRERSQVSGLARIASAGVVWPEVIGGA